MADKDIKNLLTEIEMKALKSALTMLLNSLERAARSQELAGRTLIAEAARAEQKAVQQIINKL